MNFDFIYFLKRFEILFKYIPVTLCLAATSAAIGLILGLLIALGRESSVKPLNKFLGVFVSFFRGTPLMVQLFLFYFGMPQLFPKLPVISAFYMSIIVMSINASAYMSETIRASINSVDKYQLEAAYSIGMNKKQAMIRIILPQAARIALPPLSNTFISIIQGTAITFTLGVKEIMAVAKVGSASSFKFIENFLAVGIIYWILTILISYASSTIEKSLNKAHI